MFDSSSSVTMWSSAGAFVCVVVIALLLVARRHRAERQARGLEWLSKLRSLLAHIQKHRGMCSGYLNGKTSLKPTIEQLQREVSRDLYDIANVDIKIEDNTRWKGIAQHWARLAGNYKTLHTDNCLAQHNYLIKNVLYLIDDLAQESDLLLLTNNKKKPLHRYWRELLLSAEYIGQARAIGTGVSAAAYCDSVSRIRLGHLCEKIELNTKRLWRDMGSSEHQMSSVATLLECINNELMQEHPTIEPGDFFAIATSAIDCLLEQFDVLIKEQQWS